SPVILLPGDPGGCHAAYEMVAGPAIRRRAGLPAALPHARLRLPAARKLVSEIGMTDLYRVRVADGRAEPVGSGAATGIGPLLRADGFVVVPAASEGVPAGESVTVHLMHLPSEGSGGDNALS
ncbi:MAG: hypothetical protein JNK11_01760, partial [Alphaproteobacteria bacterium]|nr:hypothetical protein [Alphaproteobacteria bacterium]